MTHHLTGDPEYPESNPAPPYGSPYAPPGHPSASGAYPSPSATAPYPPQQQYGPQQQYRPQPQQYPQQQYAYAPYPAPPYPQPYPPSSYAPGGYPPPARPQSDRRWLTGLAAVLVAVALVAAGVGAAHSHSSAVAGSGSAVAGQAPGGSSVPGGSGPSGSGPSGPTGTTTPSTGTPTAKQMIGVVTIVSVLSFQRAESAGTGMIASSSGEILTNNHVINGATAITVTDQTTGRSYRADVVGTAPTEDVAVLKLRNAAGLQTAAFATTSGTVKIGDSVVGVGNGGGTGRLSAAKGSVTDLNQSITASDENGQDAERLHGLIQINAPIISGDSGGPLYNADGKIIGINTAASTGRTTQKMAYAIPIDNARSVMRQIESGVQTATIHIGLPGFLGITSQAASGGVAVQQVVTNGPADQAGITAGALVTAIDGKPVATPTALRAVLTQKDPGDRVAVTWTDPGGVQHTKTVTLTTGPAD